MDLSNDLISKFVKITSEQNNKKTKEGTAYGTIVEFENKMYVKLDGSDLLTPINSTSDVKDGERVTIMIKDHNAVVTGNITSPSASSGDVKKVTQDVAALGGEFVEFETIVAKKVGVDELDAEVARINNLIAGRATIEDLNATNAEILNLQAKDAEIVNLVAGKAEIVDLTATNAEIENLKAKNAEITNLVAGKANISDLTAINADIVELKAKDIETDNLIADKASIDDLTATNATIGTLDAKVADIDTLVNGNLTSDNILSFNITSKNTTMEDAFIKDAMIDRITANKIISGTIDTNNVVIQSTDGSMLLQSSILQMKDESGKVRIQIGKDTGGNFTFVLYDESGKGVLIDEEGIKSSDAIADGLIVDAKVADNANISGAKLDIASVITEVNKDNSTTIKSNKIYLDEQNQSLEVAFNSLKTQVETIQDVTIDGDLSGVIKQVQSNTSQIEVNKEGINTLVAENVIRTEEISDLEGELQQVNTTMSNKYASLEQNIDGFKTTVSNTYTTKAEVNGKFANYSTTSDMNSAIDQKANAITNSVSSTYATKSSVGGLETRVSNAESKLTKDSLTTTIGTHYTTSSDVDGIVTKKGYATTSQLSQTATSLTATFKSSGGHNRIRNGAFLTGDFTGWSTWGTCDRSVRESTSGFSKCLYIKATNTNQGLQQTVSGLASGKKYTLSALVQAKSGQCAIQVNNNGTNLSTATTNTGKYEYLSCSFTASSNSVTVQLGRNGGGINGEYYFTAILLTEGETQVPWSPHPSEIYDGITQIDKDGIKVSQSNYNGYTQMKADGFYVNNGSENVISITKDGSYFKGKVVISNDSTVPTGALSGKITSTQLNSSITDDISTAKSNASTAVSTANTASTNASNAVKTANTASTNASTAVSTANTASTNASNAVKTANTASTNASTAVSTANTAKGTADTAKKTADSVKFTVDNGKTNWNNAYNRVNEWAYGAVEGSTTIDGGYIQTNTITANKIAIGDFNNYCDLRYGHDSGISWAPLNWNSSGYWDNDTTADYMQLNQEYTTYAFNNNDSINFTFDFRIDKSVTLRMGLWYYDSSYTYLGRNYSSYTVSTTGTWCTISSDVTISGVPTGTRYARLLLNLGGTGYSVSIKNVKVFRRISGELIVDGAITANKISAGAITADKIAADAITGKTIKGGSISGSTINGNTITGGSISGSTIKGNTITGGTISGTSISGTTFTSTGTEANSEQYQTMTLNSGALTLTGAIVGGTNDGMEANRTYLTSMGLVIKDSSYNGFGGNANVLYTNTGIYWNPKATGGEEYPAWRQLIGYYDDYVLIDRLPVYIPDTLYTSGMSTMYTNIYLGPASNGEAKVVAYDSEWGVSNDQMNFRPIRASAFYRKDGKHAYINATGGGTLTSASSALVANGVRTDATDFYLGVDGRARVVNKNGYNDGKGLTYKPIMASAFENGSDLMFKKNIRTTDDLDVIDILNKVDVYRYDMIGGNENEIGLIAQACPSDLICGTPYDMDIQTANEITDEDRQSLVDPDNGGASVNLYHMASILWKVCKEQQKRIEQLEKSMKGEE